ncbi:MAG: metal-dependent hydrolase [Candidatus Cloacimonetes bacterium]|nr:metal-dependent hydrolase [Candidatus Cloacimonadota bacterium]
MTLKYFGHSAFQIVTDSGLSIFIDPFISENPLSACGIEGLKADYILLTHAHADHLGDTLSLAHKKETTIVCVYELAGLLEKAGYKTHAMQIGGAFSFPFGRVKFTQALHGSQTPDGVYAGLAAGIILELEGATLYHAGDTGLFGDLDLIGDLNDIDYFLVPIGGNFTMDIQDAAIATSWINPKYAIPMHYNTFPVIKANPQEFQALVEEDGIKVLILKPGETIKL